MAESGPISDITVGNWTTDPLYEKIDESTADDSDFIVSPDYPKGEECEVKLGPVTDPGVHTNHTVYVRTRNTSTTEPLGLRVGLYQASTLIATRDYNSLPTGFATQSFTLTESEAGTITDYSDLRLRFNARTVTGSYSIPFPVEPTTYPISGDLFAYPETSENIYRLIYTGTGTAAIWQYRMPDNYYSAPQIDLVYKMQTTSGGFIQWAADVWAVSSGDNVDFANPTYDTPNVASSTIPDFSGRLGAAHIPLTNNDNLAAGDFFQIKLYRSGSNNTGEACLVGLGLTYFAK